MAARDLTIPFRETSFCGTEVEGGEPASEPYFMIESRSHDRTAASKGSDVQKSSGLLSRFVRSAFDGAINLGKTTVDGAINLGKTIALVGSGGQNQESQNDNVTFVEACKKTSKLLIEVKSKFGKNLVSEQILKDITKANEMLEMKEICISVFGQHNCGKSTLLNALIGEEFLPVYEMSETSVKIKVQHDHNTHQGVCSKNCPYQSGHSHSTLSKCCPRLQLRTSQGVIKDEINGTDRIVEYLTQLNKAVREDEKSFNVPSMVVLKVYVPLLADKVPNGWTVSLVDNPGFGEAKEHVVQLADASLLTSSAYIYLLQTENIGGTEAADFFKELARLDKYAMRDGRLAVGVTKFDNNYAAAKSKRHGRRASNVSVEKVKEKMIESIKDAVKIEVPGDTIIPLCGEWAQSASMLANCLLGDPNTEIKERAEEASCDLEKYPHLCLPRGQGQSQNEAIRQLEYPALIEHLEMASGITDLKSRICFVVGQACVKVWSTKLFSEYQRCIQEVNRGITERCNFLSDIIADKQQKLDTAEDLLKDLMSSKELIKAIVPRRRKRVTKVWKDFENGYLKDLETYRPQEQGKVKVRELVTDFKDQCKCKISSRQLGPDDLKRSITMFLKESEPKLQMVFDSSCAFWNVQSVLMENVENMVESITRLRSLACMLCNMAPEEITEASVGRRQTTAESRVLSAPHLGDIKLKVTIPSVSLQWWEKLLKMMMDLFSPSSSESERQEDDVNNSIIVNDESPPFNEEQKAPADEALEEDDEQSDSDDEEEHIEDAGNSRTDMQTVGSEDLFEACGDSETQSNASQCSTANSQNEDEAESIETKKRSNSRSRNYRRWTEELECAITELQMHMESECDRYFDVIKPKAIKFFYKDFSRKTNDRLDAFDKDYGKHLQDEHRRQKKLRTEIEIFQKEYYELHAKKIDIKRVSDLVLDAYARDFANQGEVSL